MSSGVVHTRSVALTCGYTPGPATALVATNGALLVDLPPHHPSVASLWSAMETLTPAERLVDLLAAMNPALPFALIARASAGWRIVVRNGFCATLHDQALHSQPGTAFDLIVSGIAGEWRLGTQDSSRSRREGPRLPLGNGIAGAAVIAGTRPLPTDHTGDSLLLASSVGRDQLEHRTGQQPPVAPQKWARTRGPGRCPPEIPGEAAGRRETAIWSDRLHAIDGSAEPSPSGVIAGHSVRGIEAVPRPEGAPTTPTLSRVTASGTSHASLAPPTTLDGTVEPCAPPSTLGPDPAAGPALSRTTSQPGMQASPVQSLERDTARGPTVLARLCAIGHASPHDNEGCRICGLPLLAEEPQWISRPALGRLILPNGDSVPLDRDIIVGRTPTAPDAEKPHLIRLADPGISRNHARVLLDGWQVLIRDLGSSNGTEVIAPGKESRALRPHQDYPLEPGDVVRLAGEFDLAFEGIE